MNVLQLDQAQRSRLRAWLPWHVNGTLEGADEAALRGLLAGDLGTRREANETRVLAEFVQHEEMLAPDLGRQLQRVSARLRSQRIEPPAAHAHWRVAALLLLPLVGLSALAVHQLTAPRYVTHAEALPLPDSRMLRLRVQVDVAVAPDEMATALQPFGARLAAGPTAPGLYTIELQPRQRSAVERMLAGRFAPSYLAPAAY